MKKKDSIALIEAIARAREKRGKAGMAVPGWMAPGAPESAAAQEAAGPESAAAQVAEHPAPAAHRPIQVPPAARPPAEPIVSTIPGRVRLSLSYVTCAVAAGGVVLLLAAAFLAGRLSAPRGPAAPGDSPVTPAGVGTTDTGDAGPADAEAARVEGKHYLVIQGLQGSSEAHKAEAFRIARFCQDNGMPATVNSLRSGSIIVWSLTPFDSPTDAAARQFVARAEQLGEQYFRQHRTYDFKQGRDEQGRPTGWFIPYRGR